MQKNLIEQIPVINERGIIGDVISWVSYLADKCEDAEQSLLENTVVIMAGGKGTRLDPLLRYFQSLLSHWVTSRLLSILWIIFIRMAFQGLF